MSSPRKASRENGIRSDRSSGVLAVAASLLIASGVGTADEATSNSGIAGAVRPLVSYYRPLGGPSRAVLITPGESESREDWGPFADSLRQSGFHVLVADPGAVEENATTPAARSDRFDERATSTDPAAMDPQAALCYLRDLPGAMVGEITLVGSGSGCSAVLGLREINPERFSYVFISPSGDWRNWTDGAPEGLAEHPILVVSTMDDLLSLEASAAILQEVPQKECWVVDGRGRGVELFETRPDMVSQIVTWIVRSAGAAGEEP